MLTRNRTADLLAKHSKNIDQPGFKEFISAMLVQTHDPNTDLQPVVDSIPVHENKFQPLYQSNNNSTDSIHTLDTVNTEETNISTNQSKGKKKFFDPRRIFAKKN